MNQHLFCVAAVFAAVSGATAQDLTSAHAAQPPRPKFEVASIKECRNTDRPPPSTSSPGRLSLSCWPLWRLIADAYDTFATGKVDPLNALVPRPLEGAPSWVNFTNYSIDAKAEGPESGAMMRGPLMQALLEDRFQLKIRRETREISAYILTVDKGGFKLRPMEEGSCNHVDPTDLAQSPDVMPAGKPWCGVPTRVSKGPVTGIDIHGTTIAVFSKFLRPDVRPVIDRTGLTGVFDIHLEWEPEVPGPPAPDGSAQIGSPHMSEMEAMRTQLGLRLDPGRGTREFLVIDHLERPSGN